MYPNKYEEVCEKEGNVYFDLISECKISLNRITNKLDFIMTNNTNTAGQKVSGGLVPTRNELEGELQILLNMINDIRDNIIK